MMKMRRMREFPSELESGGKTAPREIPIHLWHHSAAAKKKNKVGWISFRLAFGTTSTLFPTELVQFVEAEKSEVAR